MLICDLNNSAAVSDELLRGHIPLGVIGLPADDFKVRDRLCCDVINGRQHGETPLVGSAFSLGILIFVLAQQLWIQLGTVVGIKAVAAMKCLMDGLYGFFDAVLPPRFLSRLLTTSAFLRIRSLYLPSPSPTQAGALQLTPTPVIYCPLGSHDPKESHQWREETTT